MINIRSSSLLICLALLVVIQSGLIFVLFLPDRELSNNITNSQAKKEVLPKHFSYFSNPDIYNEAYQQAENQKIIPAKPIDGGIVPHHLIVKDKIAAFFEGLKDGGYDSLILIGPDHFNATKQKITLSRANWETPFGELEPDLDLIREISEMADTGIEESPFIGEHSITSLVSFVKKSLPNIKFTPILINARASEQEAEALAKVLYQSLGNRKALVLTSVDFSHYQVSDIADWHDMKSNDVISSFDFPRISDIEVDSPTSIYVLLKYLELKGSQSSELVFHTNSGSLIGKTDEPTTSHSFFYFFPGNKKPSGLIDMLFFGDLMLDRYVREKIEKKGTEYLIDPLRKTAPMSDSMKDDPEKTVNILVGHDIVGANLEGTIIKNGEHYEPILENDFAFLPQSVSEFKDNGFNFFNLANNHSLDQGTLGRKETEGYLAADNISYSGCATGLDQDCSIYKKSIKGKLIGFFGWNITNNRIDINQATSTVNELAQECDLVIVNIHWGTEYARNFNLSQQDIAHQLIDSGADIILGHHPHVVQGIELYQGKPIFYSLGNFIFDQYFSEETQKGLGVDIRIGENEIRYKILPIKSKNSQVSLMNNEEKNNFLRIIKELSSCSNECRILFPGMELHE